MQQGKPSPTEKEKAMFEPATRKGPKTAASAMTLLVCAAVVLGLSQTALAPPLNNGQTVVLTGAAGSNQWYWIDVPNNGRRLLVRLSGGFGNANIFVRRIGSPPPWWSNINPTNNEQVLVNNPAQGRWLIRVFGAGNYWNASLFAGFQVRNGPNWTNAAIRATPGLIQGIAQVMANRSNRDDDDDDDDDDDRRDRDRDRRDPDQPLVHPEDARDHPPGRRGDPRAQRGRRDRRVLPHPGAAERTDPADRHPRRQRRVPAAGPPGRPALGRRARLPLGPARH
jgi:hypothetical protein